jgi:hypothetical protein
MAYTEQNIVTTQRRLVKKFQLGAHNTAITFGITGNAFANGATSGEFALMTAGITNNTAKLASIKSSCNNRYSLTWGGSAGATAFDSGQAGNLDFYFERFTIPNNATTPNGQMTITPTTVTGTIILEFVL